MRSTGQSTPQDQYGEQIFRPDVFGVWHSASAREQLFSFRGPPQSLMYLTTGLSHSLPYEANGATAIR